MPRQLSVLYHDVVDGDLRASGFAGAGPDSYKLEVGMFEAHLAAIERVAAGRVALVGPNGAFSRATHSPVLLTFDDGGITAHEPTASMLEARGWRGHFFVVTARVGQPGFMSREQIVDLHRRGHHIGSHSHTHPAGFSRLSADQLLHECVESRRVLSEILGEPVWSLSVPGGYYDRTVAVAARKAGYSVLFNSEPTATVRDLNGLAILGRFSIKRETPAAFAQAIARGDVLPRLKQSIAWSAKKPVKAVGGKAWLTFRRWFFEKRA